MGLFSKRKISEPVQDFSTNDDFHQIPSGEVESWYYKKKNQGAFFSSEDYKEIMTIIGANYEGELLIELDTIKGVNYYQWMDDVKRKGKVISRKVYLKAVALAEGREWLSDEEFEKRKSDTTIITEINDSVYIPDNSEIDEIYDNCSDDDFDEIDYIREEDDDLCDELEDWILEGRILDEDDAKEWLKETGKDRVYTSKYLRKRVKLILIDEDIFL